MAKRATPTKAPGTTRAVRSKSGGQPAQAADSVRPATNGTHGISEFEIAHRAFELYCARGRQHGHDLDDWFQAESELRMGAS